LDAGIEADPAAHPNRAGEPDLLQSVVDAHLHVLDVE
jgi:hypothetical protein